MLYRLDGRRAKLHLKLVSELAYALKRLKAEELERIESHLNKQIDDQTAVNSGALGAKLAGTPLELLRDSDPNVYGLVFGALLFEVFQKRPERWMYEEKDDLAEISNKWYFRSEPT